MSGYEVPEPIINSPYEEPQAFWHIVEGETPEKRDGRRPAMYYYRDPRTRLDQADARQAGVAVDLKGNASGKKLPRPLLRDVPLKSFHKVASIGELSDIMFGAPPAASIPPSPTA